MEISLGNISEEWGRISGSLIIEKVRLEEKVLQLQMEIARLYTENEKLQAEINKLSTPDEK